MAAPDAYVWFLIDAGADTVAHSGRTFYAHLIGTHDLLEQWGNAADICSAGLFHAVYGTKAFNNAIIPLRQRSRVARLIGVRAEALAYTFGTTPLPRARTFINPETPDRTALCEIEAANLLEQGSVSPWLTALAPHVSPPARAAIEKNQGGPHALHLRRA